MPLNWTTTERVALDRGVKALAYGGSGTGKTVLCATAPRPIIISAESGLLSLKKSNLERHFGVGNPNIYYDIPVLEIKVIADLSDVYKWLTEAHDAKMFDTICMDSVTEIAERVLANAKTLQADGRKAYGDMAEKMIQLVKAYRDIPDKNVYVSAKMEKDKDEVSGMVLYGPMMPGKQVGPQLPYLFDEVFRLGVGKDQAQKEFRFIQTAADLQYSAKDRSGTLAAFEPPDLTHIFNKIRGT